MTCMTHDTYMYTTYIRTYNVKCESESEKRESESETKTVALLFVVEF